MTLLLIPAIWILALALVAGLCMAASRGDSQHAEAGPETRQDRRRVAGESRPATIATPATRRAAVDHGELAGASQAAA